MALGEAHEVGVHKFGAVVVVQGVDAEGEAGEHLFQSGEDAFRAFVPDGADLGPLRAAVGQCQHPNEVVPKIASAKSGRIHLNVAGLNVTRRDTFSGTDFHKGKRL